METLLSVAKVKLLGISTFGKSLCGLYLFIFVYLFILPHHKYSENNKRENRKNGSNNGEDTQSLQHYCNIITHHKIFCI